MIDQPGAQAGSPTLTDDDMPPLFHHADQRAIKAQNRFFSWLSWELVLLGLGVLVGTLSGVKSIGPVPLVLPSFTVAGLPVKDLSDFEVAEAALLAVALIMRVIRVTTQPEKLWYEARAVAESVKSIAWRYAVGGEPFQKARTDEALSVIVSDRFNGIRIDLSKYKAPEAIAQQHQVTSAMRAVRALPLDDRKRIYRTDRVVDQQGWYTRKSAFNKGRARLAHGVLILVEVLAVCAPLLPIALTALHVYPLNLQSLLANVAGGGVAWMQSKRYEDLTASYSVTARELKQVALDIDKIEAESDWARFVENAEGAMSREHQLWRATRVD